MTEKTDVRQTKQGHSHKMWVDILRPVQQHTPWHFVNNSGSIVVQN